MVIIGTDAVSLYPSLTKQESADEVAETVMESSLKWEGMRLGVEVAACGGYCQGGHTERGQDQALQE